MEQKSPDAFRTISEVADWLGVPTHVLRFWESRFAQVKPVKRAGGRRYYRPADMELLGGIRKLLHEDGMTIRGVQKLLREQGVRHVAEMSPPIDEPAGTMLEEQALDDAGIEDLEDIEVTDTVAEEDNVVDFIAPPSEPAPTAEPVQPGLADEKWAELSADETPEPVAEAAPEAPASPEVATPETSEPEAAADPGEALPEPDLMGLLAQDAAVEAPEAPEPEPPIADDEPTESPALETDPDDPMSSPEALDFSAHDGAPEMVEGADSPAVPRMPEIGEDPEDDADFDDEAGAAPITARIRLARERRRRVDVAQLAALTDRLETLAGQMEAARTGHRSF